MIIRNFEEKDVKAMTDIYNYHIQNTTVVFETAPFSEEKMHGMIAEIALNYPVIIAESDDGETIGYAYIHSWKSKPAYKTTAESTLYVREDMKGKGVGKKLLDELIDRSRATGIHALVACITADNSESIRFHLRNGFKKVSHFSEVGRKFDRWLDIEDFELII